MAALTAFFEFVETRFVRSTESEEARTQAVALATAVLLMEVARADFDVSNSEIAAVHDLLRERLDMSAAEVTDLLEQARRQSEQAVSMYRFTRLVNDNFAAEDKSRIVEMLWRVAFADGRLDRYEDQVVRKIADLIYVPHSELIRTRNAVMEAMGTA